MMEELINDVVLTINGKVYKVDSTLPLTTSLNTFLRDVADLTGTKYMCTEGGCGACIVSVKALHPVTQMEETFALNSCMIPVRSCHGFMVTTIEELGNQSKGYNTIQTQLATQGGSQCGYCSPGMIMNMYSLLKSNPALSMGDIENYVDGNICRCTGYRPILAAFKSFARDNEESQLCADIEDTFKIVPGSGIVCRKNCNSCKIPCKNKQEIGTFDLDDDLESSFLEIALAPKSLKIESRNSVWYKVSSRNEIFQLFDYIGNSSYKLLAGNTARGVYPGDPEPAVYIDVRDVPELRSYLVYNNELALGGNMTLAEVIKLFSAISKENPVMFDYLIILRNHLLLVANSPIRNIATIAGNLMIKYYHREFVSDVFVLLETVGATITLSGVSGTSYSVSMLEFLDVDMKKQVIYSVNLPALNTKEYFLRTYKIMPRARNTPAIVNAGFLYKLNRSNMKVLEKPRIVYGGINAGCIHAWDTETYLFNKPIKNIKYFKGALDNLDKEIKPDTDQRNTSPKYRKLLALGLYYRSILSLDSINLNSFYSSGSTNLQRPLSSGIQNYPTTEADWPVTKPVPKLEGLPQCSGELEYTNDTLSSPHHLSAQFVISDLGPAEIENMDPTIALSRPGVVAFFSAKDIPGVNSFTPAHPFVPESEELFASSKVLYAGQPLGVIIAESRELAIEAAKLVKVTYKNKSKPLVTIDDVLNSDEATKAKNVLLLGNLEPTNAQTDAKTIIKGEFQMGGQYHYTMEPHSCIVKPTGFGLQVNIATQWMMATQEAISKVLKIPESSITVEVKQCGGAFGGKITRPPWLATAASLAAYKLNKSVEFILPLETTMKAFGKRCQYVSKYEVGVNSEGKIKYMNLDIFENVGSSLNDPVIVFTMAGVPNGYDISPWKVRGYAVKTDIPSSVWMRAPGSLEAVTTVELIMEHIAYTIKKDPADVRAQNFRSESPIPSMIQSLKSSSDYKSRELVVTNFNMNNRWTKRGIAISSMAFPIEFFLNYYSMVSIYSGDGSVVICHGGIEMGQGVNTKAAQVCAHTLGISLDLVKVTASSSVSSPDTGIAGASITSDTVAYATIKCCEELNRRLEPIRIGLKNPTWQELVSKAYLSGVNLNTSYMWSPSDPIPKKYEVYGVAAIEVEVDVLTGQTQIIRADLLEDCGKSLSPLVDIGQMEGGFVMGLGNFLMEELKYNSDTGELLTNRTWNYTPPGAKDIPIDFRINIQQNVENPLGVLRSKATGEPPTCLANSVLHAIRKAVNSARKDSELSDEWYQLDAPCTPERILLACGTSKEQFKF